MDNILFAQYKPIVDELRTTLLAVPGQIAAQKTKACRLQEKLRDRQRTVDEAREAVKSAEALLTLAISVEVDGNGKALFSNDKARAGELASRKKTDPEYLSATAALKDAEQLLAGTQGKLDMERVELERLQNTMATRIALAELTAAELTALTKIGPKL